MISGADMPSTTAPCVGGQATGNHRELLFRLTVDARGAVGYGPVAVEMGRRSTMTKEPPQRAAKAPNALEAGWSLEFGAYSMAQAAGERRGEGEPLLDRRSAPSHPRQL